MSVTDFLERGTKINPDGPCIIKDDKQYTYKEMLSLVNQIANALISEGYGFTQNAGVLSENEPVGFACTLGIMRAGMTYIPMDFRNTEEENFKILDFGDCEVLFYHSRFSSQINLLRIKLPKIRLFVCIDRPLDGIVSLMEWIEPHRKSGPEREIPLETIAWLQTGSGTTGDFKMTMISHRAYHASTTSHLIWLPDPKPVMLVAAPITHAAGGFSYHVLAVGGTLIIMEKPEPQHVLAAIQRYKITKLFMPPTVIYRLLAQPNVRDFNYKSLKYFIYSASPMSVEKLREAIDVFGPVLTQGYGQTEGLGIAIMTPADHFINEKIAPDSRLSACGRPALPFCRVAIMNDSNSILSDGEVGEICARGDQVMSGYYKNPYATKQTIIDGWLHTGDIGFVDDQGFLHIIDRKKDMIITGGFNVYASEVEQVITTLEAIQECAVIGVPDDDWGEAVKAVVELVPGKTVDTKTIIALCKERLGSVKSPKTVDFIDELPRSLRGKVLKRVLRDNYWKGKKRKI